MRVISWITEETKIARYSNDYDENGHKHRRTKRDYDRCAATKQSTGEMTSRQAATTTDEELYSSKPAMHDKKRNHRILRARGARHRQLQRDEPDDIATPVQVSRL